MVCWILGVPRIWDSSEICGTMFDRKNMPLLYISYSAKIGRLRINQCTLQACGPVPFLPFKVTQGHRKWDPSGTSY